MFSASFHLSIFQLDFAGSINTPVECIIFPPQLKMKIYMVKFLPWTTVSENNISQLMLSMANTHHINTCCPVWMFCTLSDSIELYWQLLKCQFSIQPFWPTCHKNTAVDPESIKGIHYLKWVWTITLDVNV